MTTSTPVADDKMQSDSYWENGRLIAHISGSDAGSLRLDIDLPDYASAAQAAEHVQLVIPGETSPLSATGAVGENGRFVLSFFSSDIANAGHVPAEAVVRWDSDAGENRMRSVKVVSAMQAELDGGEEAVNKPGGTTDAAYPRTVGLLAIGGLALALIVAIALLLQAG